MGTGILLITLGLIWLMLLGDIKVAQAHGFGERYDLPVPLALYVAGAGATVLLSFLLIPAVARITDAAGNRRIDLLRWRTARAVVDRRILFVIKLVSVSIFSAFLFAGLFGSGDSNRNLAPTMVWVVFWVGLVYVSGLIGNVWGLINPWKILFGWAEWTWSFFTARSLPWGLAYPDNLGVWPAVILFTCFAWIEIAYPGSAIPSRIALLTLAYTVVTFAGMFVFGRDVWLKRGEAFTVAMDFFARLAPTEVRLAEAGGRGGVRGDEPWSKELQYENRWNLRWWGSGLLTGERLTGSESVFLIVMLSTVSFDGFTETPIWARFLAEAYNSFSWLGIHTFTGIKTFGLVCSPFVLFGAFAFAVRMMRSIARSAEPTLELMGSFAVSLVPIAFAYHVAHFFSFLLIQGQRVIPLTSDPFGRGWDLFGTADYDVDIGIINARLAWVVGIGAIVLGHMIAVYAAHVISTWEFPDDYLARRSQYPMTALMIGYTMLSLWIVAQPIVRS